MNKHKLPVINFKMDLLVLVMAMIVIPVVSSQITYSYVVSTLAGSGTGNYSNGIGTYAAFDKPYGITVDSNDNIYVADTENNLIRLINQAGLVSTVAGTYVTNEESQCPPDPLNGLGTFSAFCHPLGVTADSNNNLYVADSSFNLIRLITVASGYLVTTVAGNNNIDLVNGCGTYASFYYPSTVAISDSGEFLYIADSNHNAIRVIDVASSLVTTLAGSSASASGSSNGLGTYASFYYPFGMSDIDLSNLVYVADTKNNLIRLVTSSGLVSTFAGGSNGSANGLGTFAQFNQPHGNALNPVTGNLIVIDTDNFLIRQVNVITSEVTTVAGTTNVYGSANGVGTYATFSYPTRVAFDSLGNMYITGNMIAI